MKIHDCIQGSDEWVKLRLGIPTASEFDRIVTPAKLQYAASAHKYLCVKLAEWLKGEPLEAFVSPWMDRGTQLEPEAIRYYEMDRGCDTIPVGFVTNDDGTIGASPDRIVGADGLLEQKCPALETHVGYMLTPESLASEYRIQVQGQLYVCERKWCDIQSYYPGVRSVIVRVARDEKVIYALQEHVGTFVEKMLASRLLLRSAA
jgi:hypothetical protein